MTHKRNRRGNTHPPSSDGAVALHFDDGRRRVYVVLDVHATIVATFEEDSRGWTALADAGYGNCPVYGPMQVNPVVLDRLSNVPKKERQAVGQIVAGMLGKPLLPYLGKSWGGEPPLLANPAVQVKQRGRQKPYDAPLTATIDSHIKRKLLKR